jgi:hypothetical protein
MVLAVSIRISRVPTYSGYHLYHHSLHVQDFHPLWYIFPDNFRFKLMIMSAVLQPHGRQNDNGLGYSPFDRHYLGNHYLFSFPPGTKMFQFSGLASVLLRIPVLQTGGFPHSEICGYIGYLLLPAAYRSLSRPSSPLRAKASTMRSY